TRVKLQIVNHPGNIGLFWQHGVKRRKRFIEALVESDGGFLAPGPQDTTFVNELRRKAFARRRQVVRRWIVEFGTPVHPCVRRWVLHVLLEWPANVSRYIDGLHLQRPEVENLAALVIRNEYHVDISC